TCRDGLHPIAGMAAIAMDEKQDIGLRAQMFKELASYIAPKRKAVEMSGADGEEMTLADLVAFAEARRQFHWNPNSPLGRMLRTKAAVHIADLACEQVYIEGSVPAAAAAVELGGVRTLLIVPLLKEREPIGAFALSRQEVRPFTDKQIELVQNF